MRILSPCIPRASAALSFASQMRCRWFDCTELHGVLDDAEVRARGARPKRAADDGEAVTPAQRAHVVEHPRGDVDGVA